jgi:hypothetical protein
VQFDLFDFFFSGSFFMIFMIVPLVFFVIVAIIMIKSCRSSQDAIGSITLEAPSFVIPESRRGYSDGVEMKTVRLPDKCPSCGASLSPEGIDWVGPLEARCNYCGGTVKAHFESV